MKGNEGIIAYSGTANKGTSGSPLISEDGMLLGIAFGYFEDKYVEGIMQDCQDKML